MFHAHLKTIPKAERVDLSALLARKEFRINSVVSGNLIRIKLSFVTPNVPWVIDK
jgi:hypothetical protein